MKFDDDTLSDEQREAVYAMLIKLEAAANEKGWDQRPQLWKFYLDEDQELQFSDRDDVFANLPGDWHPGQVLEELYEQGFRAHPKTLGLAVVSEGYRHRFLDEIRQNPADDNDREFIETLDHLLEIARKDLGDEAVERASRMAEQNAQLTAPPPSTLPPAKRREIRLVTAVLQNGWSLTIARTREDGKPPAGSWIEPEVTTQARVPRAMLQLLSWQTMEPSDPEKLRQLMRQHNGGTPEQ